jgi:nucleotide-binding universal stress UspA family protein
MNWFPKNRVVVPIDFSEQSIAAVGTALELVESPVGVHVVHVLQPLSTAAPAAIWGELDDETRRRHATQVTRERLSGAGYDGVQLAIAFGDPGHVIAEYAKKEKADLIVIPSHGRTGLKRLLIGSVAERVVRLAHCPVLVLRK